MSIRVQDFLKEFCHSGIGNDVKAARRGFGSSTKVSRLADVSFNELKAAFSEVCAVPRVSVLVPVLRSSAWHFARRADQVVRHTVVDGLPR